MVALPLLLVQVPPAGVEFKVVVKPIHTDGVPVKVVGFGLTVTMAVLIQPVPSVYVITDVPATEPVTTPEVESAMVALPLLLLQVPPAGVEFKVVVSPMHTVNVPVSVVGLALTVTTAVLRQPVPIV